MTKPKSPPTPARQAHDPFRIRSFDQLFALFDSGDFTSEATIGHAQLQRDLLEYRDQHGTKGCQGTMTIQISYALGKSGDVAMGASVTFKAPKKPPSSAAAYIDGETGELTLYSPLMKRMHEPPRDVTTNYDPETGEIIDID